MTHTKEKLAEEYATIPYDSSRVRTIPYEAFLAGFEAGARSKDYEIIEYREALKFYDQPTTFTVWYGDNSYEQEMFEPRRIAQQVLARYPEPRDEESHE